MRSVALLFLVLLLTCPVAHANNYDSLIEAVPTIAHYYPMKVNSQDAVGSAPMTCQTGGASCPVGVTIATQITGYTPASASELSVSLNEASNVDAPWTVILWFKTASGAQQFLLNTFTGDGLTWLINTSGWCATTGILGVGIYTGSTAPVCTGSSVATSTAFLVMESCQASGGGATCNVDIDGASIGTFTIGSATYGGSGMVGYYVLGGGGSGSNQVDGPIGSVALFTSQISDATALALYRCGISACAMGSAGHLIDDP
jgi:hypothetical protein